VHELRRALKRFRAGASLCKGAVDAVEVRAVQEEVRATAERLSATRDRDVLIETITDVCSVFPLTSRRQVGAIAVAILAPEKATTASADWEQAALAIRTQLEAMRQRMHAADLRAVGPDSIAASLSRRWRRARRASAVPWNAGHLDSLHEVRKECQRLALQLQLISRLGPRRRLERLVERLAAVVSRIGEDRDLGLLEALLVERRSEFPDPRQVDEMLREVRGLGFGTLLAAAVEDAARAAGVRRLQLGVRRDQPRLAAFWATLGFEADDFVAGDSPTRPICSATSGIRSFDNSLSF
jgi:GNAT superfamily N-acetyltransferase